VYFLINSDYELFDALENAKQFETNSVLFILVRHRLEQSINIPYKCILDIPSPFNKRFGYFKFFDLLKAFQLVKSIKNSKHDLLFFYSEYDPINIRILSKFSNIGCKLFLITILPVASHGISIGLSNNIKKYIKTAYINIVVPGMQVRHIFQNFTGCYCVNHKYITANIRYLNGVGDNRKSNKICINSFNKKVFNKNNCIVLGQPLYETGYSVETYIEFMAELFLDVTNKFQVVYFKFHPREDGKHKDIIKSIVKEYLNIIIIEDDRAIELLVNEYDFGVAISFFSTSLFSLYIHKKIEPIFIYNLLPKNINPLWVDLHADLDKTLNLIDYNFISSYRDISPYYVSNIKFCDKSVSLESLHDLTR